MTNYFLLLIDATTLIRLAICRAQAQKPDNKRDSR